MYLRAMPLTGSPAMAATALASKMMWPIPLTSADRHAIFAASGWTNSERTIPPPPRVPVRKDATDPICQPSRDTLAVFLIRRLTHWSVSGFRGSLDGWTDLPGLGLRPVQGLG